MDDFETELPEILLHGLDSRNDTPQEKIDLLKSRLKWLTFSDTIFVAMPFELSDHPDATKFNLIFFTILAAYINRRMFEIGLPVRGTVHNGDIIVSRRCFAGKAVVEAFELSKRCQLAATILSDKTYKLFAEIFPKDTPFHSMFFDSIVECDVPTEITQLPNSSLWSNSSKRMKTLCWFFLEMGKIERFIIPPDLNTYVREKFSAHGKKLSGDREIMKAFNTSKLFQDWKATSNGRLRQQVSITAKPIEQKN